MATKNTELATVTYQLPALNESFNEALGEEMDGLSINFDRAKMICQPKTVQIYVEQQRMQ